jgi:hypothetical protein
MEHPLRPVARTRIPRLALELAKQLKGRAKLTGARGGHVSVKLSREPAGQRGHHLGQVTVRGIDPLKVTGERRFDRAT